jgi:hypothetical protein
MPTIENGSAGSESWDPALWSIGIVPGIAIPTSPVQPEERE